ncbi:MAG TPA: response regulator [Ktedonobacteraceae bacterium]|jgi:CheY-like chemotaxis protein|nr:response regulator [Ktedonobacteraceae bacterium]
MQLLSSQVRPQKDERATRPLVLVVDDDHATQEMLFYALSFYGYQPICLANGKEALAWLEQAQHEGQYPQVILLDFFMPVMNGKVFLEHLPHYWSVPAPIPPVVLFTAGIHHRYDALPCRSVLRKPFHMYELNDCLKGIMQNAC